MIDDLEKADILLEKLKKSLPIETRFTQRLIRTLALESPTASIPDKCNVIDVFYAGDEGGILCRLDGGGSETDGAYVVSITHLRFDRDTPSSREIHVYQRHRIKKLKRQLGRG